MGKLDLAYFAGFFDGEGCIQIASQRRQWKGRPYRYYRLELVVASTNHWIIELMKFQFGGAVYEENREGHPKSHRPAWRWMICARRAKTFLEDVLPYLKLKRAEAEIAIKWQSERRMGQMSWGEREKMMAVTEANRMVLSALKRQGGG